MEREVIVDTDPGIDDAMALWLLLSQPHVKVKGITITHGNLGGHTSLRQLGENACRILSLAKRYDIPIFLGEGATMNGDVHPGAPFVHGEDGLGDCLPPFGEGEGEGNVEEDRKRDGWIQDGAVDFIATSLRDNASLSLICLGPLTNIGRVVERETERERVEGERGGWRERKVFIMGGAFLVPGNISPLAEANFYNDPIAADLVLTSFDDVTLCPLDVTTRTTYSSDFTLSISQSGGAVGKAIHLTNQQYLSFYRNYLGRDTADLHDSSIVAAFLWPELFTEQLYSWVRVEKESELTRGTSVGEFRRTKQNATDWKKNVKILLNVDSHTLKSKMISAFSYFAHI